MQVTGQAQIMKNLQQIQNNLKKEIAKDINETAREIRDFARQLAPEKTGTLRRSLSVVKRAHNRRLYAVIGTRKNSKGAAYARFVEFGGAGVAQPFLYPAAEVKSPTFRKRMMDAAKRGLRTESMDAGFERALQMEGASE